MESFKFMSFRSGSYYLVKELKYDNEETAARFWVEAEKIRGWNPIP